MDLSEHVAARPAAPAAGSAALVFSPHPIQLERDRELVYAHFLPQETIAEYLERVGIAARIGRQPVILTVNGRRVPRELWARCRPKPGTLINLYAVVRDIGGGKKSPLATIAMIALMVAGQAWGATLAASLGVPAGGIQILGATITQQMIGSAIITTLGGLVVNPFAPPPLVQ